MYFLFVLFYFWIEMSNGNDLVLAQLLQLVKGYHEPRVLLSALTPIISWRPERLSLHSRNGRWRAIYRWFSLVCWLKSSQLINKIIAQTTSLIRKWDLHPGTGADVKTSVVFITLSVTWNLDPRGKLDLYQWIKGHNLLSSSWVSEDLTSILLASEQILRNTNVQQCSLDHS